MMPQLLNVTNVLGTGIETGTGSLFSGGFSPVFIGIGFGKRCAVKRSTN